MPFLRPLLALLSAGLCLAGCRRPPQAATSAPEQTTTYEVRGEVRQVDLERRRVVIAHEPIPGYMEAMVMEFAVPDSSDLKKIQSADRISFRLSIGERRSWVDRVEKIGAALLALPSPPAGDGLAVGALVPDCALVDQDGRRFRLSEFKGRVVALTFIFTRCPLPDFCPRMNEQFSAAQRELPGVEWHWLSISIDPAHDTPERLAAYAPRFRTDAARWSFATGGTEEIERLAGAFGLRTVRAGAELNHTLRTVVVDPAGRVRKIWSGNEWTVAELLVEMKRAMDAAAPDPSFDKNAGQTR